MLSVLVLEAQEDLRALCVEVLETRGHRARGVATVGEALRAISEGLPEVVVFDLDDAIPIIDAITSRGVVRHVAMVLASGTQGFERMAAFGTHCLRRPFVPRELLDAVETAASNRRRELRLTLSRQ